MGVTTRDMFGGPRNGQPATPGSYGQAPRGWRLPPGTRPGAVRLRVGDLERSLLYYQDVLGLHVAQRDEGRAALGAQEDARALVELHEWRGARPAPGRGRLGLYHFALLVPDRASLARFVRHLASIGVHPGAGDHLVSEAFYLSDPDGLGIEVYADRPRDTWRRSGAELMMATDPVDIPALLDAAGDVTWRGMPAGTVMGHVHLHVGDLGQACAFYSEALGFDRMVWSYPGALFLGADGYHHHLGTNTWAGSGARPAEPHDAQLLEWTLELPDPGSVAAARASLLAGGHPAAGTSPDEFVTHDPWGTHVRVRTAHT